MIPLVAAADGRVPTGQLRAWCRETVAVLDANLHLLPRGTDRAAALVEFTLRVLADPATPGSAELLHAIHLRRKDTR